MMGRGWTRQVSVQEERFLMFTTMLGLDLAWFYETLFTCLF